jgi:ELWxxDGT repeat protein
VGGALGVSPLFERWAYINYSGKLLFQCGFETGGLATHGIELCVTDGSVAATRRLADLVPGSEGSMPRDFVDFNGLVYFQIDVTESGTTKSQLWRTDGTETGTERVNATPQINGTREPFGYQVSERLPFGVAGDRLFFGGIDFATGAELWSLENEAPVARTDAGSSGGAAVTINVLANDSDPDGTLVPGSLRIAQSPAHGTTSIDSAAGAIRYTPDAGFNGSDQFTYQVADRQGRMSAAANVSVAVTLPPDPGGSGGGGSSGGGNTGGSGGSSGGGSSSGGSSGGTPGGSSSASGGGGAMGVMQLLAMLGLLAASRRRWKVD